ncbi:hypothetical protein [Streptomyces candidus]|uniref:Uncharacterized protein n=1 Tax=Streptomyces candidus TaxID=67283 RepID=A0A7X0LPE8_9ACTN|nr:hypothetical protein [Streptomyces candidus]MBB6435882.1 hypothetical protein [Streptomyces candidus]
MVWSACAASLAMGLVAVAVATGRPPLALVLAGVLVERFATAVYEAAARGTIAMPTPPEGYARTVSRPEVGERPVAAPGRGWSGQPPGEAAGGLPVLAPG